MQTINLILSQIDNYIASLDWAYILTFIIITIGINGYCLTRKSKPLLKTRTRYRVALIGLLYGTLLYLTRSYSPGQAETLFQSFVFALVFHKLIIEAVLYWFVKNGLSEPLAGYFIDQKKIRELKRGK